MHRSRKWMAIILSVLITISFMPAMAFAAEEDGADGEPTATEAVNSDGEAGDDFYVNGEAFIKSISVSPDVVLTQYDHAGGYLDDEENPNSTYIYKNVLDGWEEGVTLSVTYRPDGEDDFITEDFTWNEDNMRWYNDAMDAYIEVYVDLDYNEQLEHQTEILAGKAIDATLYAEDHEDDYVSCTVGFKVIESPVTAMKFTPAKRYVYYPTLMDPNEISYIEDGEVVYCDWPGRDNFNQGDVLTVTENGVTSDYVYQMEEYAFVNDDGDMLEVGNDLMHTADADWYEIGTHTATLTYKTKSCTYEIYAEENPVESIRYTTEKEYNYLERGDGEEVEDADGNTYFKYEHESAEPVEGDVLSVTTADGTKDYVYTYIDLPVEGRTAVFLNEDDSDDYIRCDSDSATAVWIEDTQEQDHWTLEDGGYYTVTYMGRTCQGPKVTLTENTVQRIEYEPDEYTIYREVEEKYLAIDDEEGTLGYIPPHKGDKLTIFYKDGTSKTYTAKRNGGYDFECQSADSEPETLLGSVEIRYDHNLEDGDVVYVRYAGQTDTITLNFVDSNVESLEFVPVEELKVFETNHRESDGYREKNASSGYTFGDSAWFEEGDKLIVHYTDGTTTTMTVTKAGILSEDGEFEQTGTHKIEYAIPEYFGFDYHFWDNENEDGEVLPGTYQAVLSYLGCSVEVPYTVIAGDACSLTDNGRIAPIEDVEWDGEACEPDVEVYIGQMQLEKDVDYTLSYENNNAPGEATVTATAKRNTEYSGSVSATFRITGEMTKNIEDLDWSLTDSVEYDGTAQTPKVTLHDGETELTEGEDYTVSYGSNNTKVGTVDVTITGINGYTGEIKTSFDIVEEEHHWDEGTVTPATCIKDGNKHYVCEACGATTDEPIKATGHVWERDEATSVAATCTKDGYTRYICEACGATKAVVVDATGHEWELDEANSVAATCGKDGNNHYVCKNCDETKDEAVTKTGNHEWELDEATSVAATCGKDGNNHYNCKNCDETKDEAVTKTGNHEWELDEATSVAATCGKDGNNHYNCKNCDETKDEAVTKTGNHEWELDEANSTAENCTVDGNNHYTCKNCDETKDEAVTASGHKWVDDGSVKAGFGTAGTIKEKCENCGEQVETAAAAVKSASLSATTYVYSGSVRKPSVKVVDVNGTALAEGVDYTVAYPSGMKNVGAYKVVVTLKGNYAGSKTLVFKINPKGTALKKLSSGKKAFTATWTKQATQTTGYQIQASLSSKYNKGNKTYTVASAKKVKTTCKKLKGKKKYFVRIRTYKTVGGVKYYSAWSKTKTVKTK